MKTPCSAVQVDALLKACIEYHDQHEQYFAVANIAGRTGIPADTDSTKELMDWVVENHQHLLVSTGLGLDNVRYYRLGWDAKQIMNDGGFAAYLQRQRRSARIAHAKDWIPIAASIAAVVVSVFAWLEPKENDRAIAKANEHIELLESRLDKQMRVSAALAVEQAQLQGELEKVVNPKPAKGR